MGIDFKKGWDWFAGEDSAIQGGLDWITGRGKKKDDDKLYRAQKKQQKKVDKYNKKVWKYDWKQSKRKYEHQKESVQLAKENNREEVNYQNNTSIQNWKHQLAIDDYKHEREKEAWNKSEETYKSQLDFNEKARNVAEESIDNVLGEKFLQTSFESQQVFNDFFTEKGNTDFAKAETALALQEQKDLAGYEDAKLLSQQNQTIAKAELGKQTALTELEGQRASFGASADIIKTEGRQRQADLAFEQAGSKLEFEDALSGATFEKAGALQEVENAKASQGIAKAGLGLDLEQNESQFRFTQKKNAQALGKLRAAQAFEADNIALQALQKKGQARLTQAGRSSGASVVAVLAAMGQQQTAIVDSIVRDTAISATEMQEAANVKDLAAAKTGLSGASLDQDLFDKVSKAKLALDRADANISLAGKKSDLTINKLDKNIKDIADMSDLKVKKELQDVTNLADMTEQEMKKYDLETSNIKESTKLDQTHIADKLRANKAKAALSDEKMDWSLLQEKTKMQLNQKILGDMLDNAVKQATIDKKKVGVDKYEADILAKANRMIKPVQGPTAPKPIKIPYSKFQDPLRPKRPPKPLKGAALQKPKQSGVFGLEIHKWFK